ncbi:MAG: DinB family protein [Pyrinomonadaceae bacterium]
MLDVIKRLFAYDAWANARALDSLKGAQSRAAVAPLAHLLVSERIWLMRLRGEDTSAVDKSPEMSHAECESLAVELRASYASYIDSLGEEDLGSPLVYRNFKGTEFRTPVGEILTHVSMHGTYHRGQVAKALRAEGHAPADTDYITFVRETAV